MAVVGRYLYVVGGKSFFSEYLNNAERYDPKTDKWTNIHSLDVRRSAMGAANLFGKLVIVGWCYICFIHALHLLYYINIL